MGGAPVSVIGIFEEFLRKRLKEETYSNEFWVSGEAVNEQFAQRL